MATITRKSAAPAVANGKFDGEFDVIVVGSGIAGSATALFSAGTATRFWFSKKRRNSAARRARRPSAYWVPNNAAMRAAAPRIRRTAFATWRAVDRKCTNADAPRSGMPEREYSQYEAIYDNASTATELLSKKGALEYRHCDFVPDYWAELPEQGAERPCPSSQGRARDHVDGGEVAVKTMSAAAKNDGVDVRASHRVQRVIKNARRNHRRRGRHRQGQEALLRAQSRRVLHAAHA